MPDTAHLLDHANALATGGIEAAPCDFYESRQPPSDSLATNEDYYEAFLEPQPHFPWNIEAAIQHHVRRRLKKRKKEEHQMTMKDSDDFDLDSLLTRLAHAAEPERAQSISRMLLDFVLR